MRGITKRFGSFVANDAVDFDARSGEVHALLGENGAGKTTLMNQLYGMLRPSAGEIIVDGERAEFRGPSDAIARGIGMVHQHFMLVRPFTVAENICLGMERVRGPGVLDRRAMVRDVEELSARHGLKVDPRARIEDLSVGAQQRVEILKTLYRGARILVLDEPTAVLTPQEVDELAAIVRSLAEAGKTVVIITHKLREILSMADRCTVIRRGKKVGTVEVAGATERSLAEMMVKREVRFSLDKAPFAPGEPVLEVEGLAVRDARGLPALKDLSLSVRRGEILGVAGVDGNGQSELVQALAGLRRAESGEIKLRGKGVSSLRTRERIAAGMGGIPEDRQRRGLVMGFTVEENLALERVASAPFSRRGLLDAGAMRSNARDLIEKFDIRPPEPAAKAGSLSGGNQQKVVIAREVSNDPALLVASQPTRGLDVGAIEFVHRALLDERARGKAILLVSMELQEILALSDRIIVLYEGAIAGEMDAAEADERKLGFLMAGGKIDA